MNAPNTKRLRLGDVLIEDGLLTNEQLTEALGEIPIPDISGFTLSEISITTDGAENGYVTASGELVRL